MFARTIRGLATAAALAAVALTSAGCSDALDKFETIASIATGSIQNPVGPTDVYRAKNTYAATLQIADDWRTYCYSKPYSQIVGDPATNTPADPIMKPVCQSRRSTVRAIKLAKAKAKQALADASAFIENNPTVSAVAVVNAAWAAVQNFQSAVPAR